MCDENDLNRNNTIANDECDVDMEEEEDDDALPVKRLEFPPLSEKKVRPAPISGSLGIAPIETKESISVFLRVRPGITGNPACLDVIDKGAVRIRPPKDSTFIRSGADQTSTDKYYFTNVFDHAKNQEEVYQETAAPLVESLLSGQNGLLFSYGPTNAGKTYTIQGKPENEGILPRALRAILGEVAARNQRAADEGEPVTHEVWATYLEIYNENIYDLLATGRQALKIKEDGGNIVVKGLKEVKIRNLGDAKSILDYGQENRQVAETMVNQDSSRSHSIFNIRVEQIVRSVDSVGSEVHSVTSSKLSIVDLAGSERSSRTQNTGIRLKEASNINVSLMNLGRCLEALRWNQQHPTAHPHMVPFRQSKLTRIFQDWFTIRSHMVMLVNVSPDPCDFEEMLQALRYGAIAKDITIVTKVNTTNITRIASSKKKVQTQSSTKPVVRPQVEDDGWTDEMEEMASQIQLLQTQLYETQSRCAQIECSVREEVIEESLERIREMEHSFLIRIENERIATEEKCVKKVDIVAREAARRYKMQHQNSSDAENRELVIQLEYFKRRVEEMQREHKIALHKLQPCKSPVASNNNNTTTTNNIITSNTNPNPELDGDMQLRLGYLQGEIAALQSELADTVAQLAAKNQALLEARQLNENYEQALMQVQGEKKLLEDQNDRLREEVASRGPVKQEQIVEDLQAQLRAAEAAKQSAENKCGQATTKLNAMSAKFAVDLQQATEERELMKQNMNSAYAQMQTAEENSASLSQRVEELSALLEMNRHQLEAERRNRQKLDQAAATSSTRKRSRVGCEDSNEPKHNDHYIQADYESENDNSEDEDATEEMDIYADAEDHLHDDGQAAHHQSSQQSSHAVASTPEKRDSFVVIGSDHSSSKKKKLGLFDRCKALVTHTKKKSENENQHAGNVITIVPEAPKSRSRKLYNPANPAALDEEMAPQQPIARRLRSRNGSQPE